MDENTFVAADQTEREIIWDALNEYRKEHPEYTVAVSEMIERVSQTFSWVRNS